MIEMQYQPQPQSGARESSEWGTYILPCDSLVQRDFINPEDTMGEEASCGPWLEDRMETLLFTRISPLKCGMQICKFKFVLGMKV